MSEASKAVFLSYASQDAEAVRRLADALRHVGVEVWFDQNELVGGDAWDAKIRGQIASCALFVPVISAATQARREGYFRLEWKLAAQRTHMIADGTPFLFPVVIDETREADALVPAEFKAVQWTRLRQAYGGLAPTENDGAERSLAAFAARVRRVLDREEERAPAGAAAPASNGPTPTHLGAGKVTRWWLIFPVLGMVAGLVFALKFAGPRAEPRKTEGARQVEPVAEQSAKTPARQLALRADELFSGLDANRDDFALAEDLLKQAVTQAPGDAEVWATQAQLHLRYQARGWDTSNERREAARTATQRALRLDPNSFEARFAAAMRFGGGEKDTEESVQALRVLLRERPEDKRVLRALSGALRYLPGHETEILELCDRAARLPGGDPLALYNKAMTLWFAGRAREANAAIKASLAQQPFVGARLLEALFALSIDGDLDRAQSVIAQLPSAALLEDRGCYFAYLVHSYRNEPEQALAVVQAFSREWLADNWCRAPRALLAGDALWQAGRREAAMVEWRAALKAADQRLATNPNDLTALGNRLLLLGKLGEVAAARQMQPMVRQLVEAANPGGVSPNWYAQACLAMGDREDALRLIGVALKSKRHATYYTASDLRHDPVWASLRDDPGFHQLIEEAERLERAEDAAVGGGAGTAVAPLDERSIAVLAFANLSDDKGNEYFSDGISEELLNVLAKIPGLKVAARTSAFYFKGRDVPMAEIAQKLGVAYVVEGSVRKAGDKVRIAAQLVKAADGFQVWGDTFTRELKDVFAVQDELAQTIVTQLRSRIGGGTPVDAMSVSAQVAAAEKGGTRNVEAHELYLRGKFLRKNLTMADTRRAESLLRRAVELDPGFALGWAELSKVGWGEAGYGMTAAEMADGFRLAREAAQRARAIEPDLIAGLVALFNLQVAADYDWKGAAATLQRAQALAPDDPEVAVNALLFTYTTGDAAKAAEMSTELTKRDPMNAELLTNCGFALLAARQPARAEALFRRIVEFSAESPWGHAGVALALAVQGRGAPAVEAARRSTMPWARDFALSVAWWANGQRPESETALQQLISGYGEVAAFQIACAYAFRGDRDQTFAWLDRAYRQRDPGLSWCKADYFLSAVHDDRRWPAFLRSLGLNDEQLR